MMYENLQQQPSVMRGGRFSQSAPMGGWFERDTTLFCSVCDSASLRLERADGCVDKGGPEFKLWKRSGYDSAVTLEISMAFSTFQFKLLDTEERKSDR